MSVSKKKPSHAPEYAAGQPLAVQLRGSPEWKQWVEDLAKANRQSVSGLVDTALATIAKQIGFREPPDR